MAPECGKHYETGLKGSDYFCEGCDMKQHSPTRILSGRFTKEGIYKVVDKTWETTPTKENAVL